MLHNCAPHPPKKRKMNKSTKLLALNEQTIDLAKLKAKCAKKSDDILNLSPPYLEIDWLITLSPAYFLQQFMSLITRKPVFGIATR